MLPIGLAGLAALCWGSGDFVGGVLTKRLSARLVLLVTQGAGLMFTGAVVLAVEPSPPASRAIAFGLLGGVLGAVGLAALYKGLAVGRMGIVAPIAAMSIVVPVTVGFLQGDRPSHVQIGGMVLAVVGAVLAATAPDPADGRRKAAEGLTYAVVAAVFLGGLLTCLDAAGDSSAVWSAFTLRLSSVPLLAIAALAARTSPRALTGRDLGILVGVGVVDNGANILFSFAASRGLLALVSVIASLVPVVTVLLARFVLHEHLTRHQVVGVAIALAGVALIAAG